MNEYCIYRITCAANGKQYIGLTKVGVGKRFAAHKYKALRGETGALAAAIRKHGVDSFSVETLEADLTKEQACEREIALIVEHDTRPPRGYNIAAGGESGSAGLSMSDEHKAKLSALQTERMASAEHRALISNALRGVPKTLEHVAKVSAALIGKTHSNETRAKLSAAATGRKQSAETIERRAVKLRGKKRSPEAIERTAAAHRGKPKSEAHRRAISESLKGRKLPPEHVAASAAARRGKPKSEEWKAKMRASWVRRKEAALALIRD